MSACACLALKRRERAAEAHHVESYLKEAVAHLVRVRGSRPLDTLNDFFQE